MGVNTKSLEELQSKWQEAMMLVSGLPAKIDYVGVNVTPKSGSPWCVTLFLHDVPIADEEANLRWLVERFGPGKARVDPNGGSWMSWMDWYLEGFTQSLIVAVRAKTLDKVLAEVVVG